MAKKSSRRRNSKGRFVSMRAAANPRRQRAVRRHASNPRRVRAVARRNPYFANPRRRHYKRNPALFGGNRILGMSFMEIGFAGAGFIAPPLIEGALSGVIPDTLKTSKVGKYAVKAGIVAAMALIGGKFISREAGKYLAIGGTTYLVANLIVEFAPTLFSGFSGYYGTTRMVPGQTFTRPGLRGGQPGLGSYYSGAGAISQAGVPTRLSVGERL